jgi:LysM repeat protein
VQRFLAPAAFLAAATVAVVLVRSGLEAGDSPANATGSIPTVPLKHIVTTTPPTTTAKRKTKTTKTRPKPAGRRFWTVRAGDTFAVISSQTGVPIVTIQQLNPNVASTSLFIGQKLRLR